MTIGSIEGIFCLFFFAFDCEERQYLLAGIGRQVEGEDGQKGDAHARDDEVDGVEERLAAHRDVERDVQVGLDAARVVLFPSAFQNTNLLVRLKKEKKKKKTKRKAVARRWPRQRQARRTRPDTGTIQLLFGPARADDNQNDWRPGMASREIARSAGPRSIRPEWDVCFLFSCLKK